MSGDRPGTDDAPLVEAVGLYKSFRRPAGFWGGPPPEVHAVSGVDLSIRSGETVGLVGESGSGKSTLGRLLIRLLEPDRGQVRFEGTDLATLGGAALRRARRHFQFIFQDPFASLNPRMRIGTAIGEPLTIHGLVSGRAERQQRVAELLEQVGLEPEMARRYPHEFSGGQRQRIGIARAIACSPRFVVADEPVSALDTPVQAQIINLLIELQERLSLAYLLIAHDLRLVEQVCDRVVVMYLGRVVESAPAEVLYRQPLHPYTRALLASTPTDRPGTPTPPAIVDEPPSPTDPPPGCAFHPRCPVAEPICREKRPELLAIGTGQQVACHLAGTGSSNNG